MYDPKVKQIYMIDLEHVGILTESFASYALYVYDGDFLKAIEARLGYRRSNNLLEMYRAAELLLMSGDCALGKSSKNWKDPAGAWC